MLFNYTTYAVGNPAFGRAVLDLVAHPCQSGRDPLAMVALNLQLAILKRAAGPTLLLELLQQRLQRGRVVL